MKKFNILLVVLNIIVIYFLLQIFINPGNLQCNRESSDPVNKICTIVMGLRIFNS